MESCIGNHPQILRFVDTDDDISPHYIVAVEKETFLQCSSVANALYFLFSVHYIFNMEYCGRVSFGIKEAGVTCSANYTNVISLLRHRQGDLCI